MLLFPVDGPIVICCTGQPVCLCVLQSELLAGKSTYSSRTVEAGVSVRPSIQLVDDSTNILVMTSNKVIIIPCSQPAKIMPGQCL